MSRPAQVQSDHHPATASLSAAMGASLEVDALIQPHLDAAVTALGPPDQLMSRMARYHLGEINDDGSPAADTVRLASRGKRLRPAIALLSCAAADGDPVMAAPMAAAIELLHQFTLIHDDIQDESPTRRHRPTVWKIWGVGQAINAGDAVHAAAHVALYRLATVGVPVETVVQLANAYDHMTIDIVQGQVRDLGFEGRDDVRPDDYIEMISGKTSAILRYAAEGGAIIAGADPERVERFARFGLSLGIGFQIQDDLLGIWGEAKTTGKAAADDIRRRKQSLPILLLRAAASPDDRARLDQLYRADEIDEAGVAEVLGLLDRYGIRDQVIAQVETYHEAARTELEAATGDHANPARETLLAVVEQLAVRDF